VSTRRRSDDGLRRIVQDKIPRAHWQPIETGGIAPGVPDLNGVLAGTESWVECKATDTMRIKFEPGQIPWIDRRTRAGGRVWIAIRRRHEGGLRRGPAVDQLWLYPGYVVKELASLTLDDPLISMSGSMWEGGPSGWNWTRVEARIFG
jgi:hypothetical protein